MTIVGMTIQRLSDPAAEPLDLEMAKAHLRVSGDNEDDILENIYIPAARAAAEEFCNRYFARAEFAMLLSGFSSAIELHPDTVLISSVTYTDAAGDEQTVDSMDYQIVSKKCGLFLESLSADGWPSGSDPKIRFWAGPDFGASPAGILAKTIMAAMLLHIGDLFETREQQIVGTIISVNPAYRSLLQPHRIGLGV